MDDAKKLVEEHHIEVEPHFGYNNIINEFKNIRRNNY